MYSTIDSRVFAKNLNIKGHFHWLKTVKKYLGLSNTDLTTEKTKGRPARFFKLTAEQVKDFVSKRYREKAAAFAEILDKGFAPLVQKVEKAIVKIISVDELEAKYPKNFHNPENMEFAYRDFYQKHYPGSQFILTREGLTINQLNEITVNLVKAKIKFSFVQMHLLP
jgi:hypothetical protein